MKLLWHSNSPSAPTGYGNQTDLFTRLIHADDDYQVCISAFYGREGGLARASDTGITELPRHKDPYGNDIIQAHYHYNKAESVVSLIDPWVLTPLHWGNLNWCAWVPVDSAPVSPENVAVLKHAKHVWSMSKFGHEQLKQAGFDPVYVPHGVDTSVFIPMDRAFCRKEFETFIGQEIGDKFLVVSVAANKGHPSRKNFAGMIEAFSIFHKDHPDSVFYIHTEPYGHNNGDHLYEVAKAYGVEDAVIFPPHYPYITNQIAPSFLNKIYNAADVFMLLSYGEGFGIPIVEAQASGCPVIVTDGSAMAELCFSGSRVKAREIMALNGRFGCRWWMASVDGAANALDMVYKYRDNEDVREKARRGALAYDYRHVYKAYMKPALEALTPPRPSPTRGEGRGGALAYDYRHVYKAYMKPALEALTPQTPLPEQERGSETPPLKKIMVGDVELAIYENPTGGTAKDAAIEAIRDYGLDQIELEDGDLVVDVGANVGIVSLYLAKKFPNVRVIAFEPHPETFDYLKLNVEVNGVDVDIKNVAVGDNGYVYLAGDVNKNAGGIHSFGNEGTPVRSWTLSSVVFDKPIALLKLDCEGAEWEILRGADLSNVKRIRGELHTNSTLHYDHLLIDRVLMAVPDTVFTVREIADFDSPHPPTPSPTRGEGEKDAEDDVPDVTVIIPTLNGAETIERAISYALAQPDISVEVIVIDDGSMDDTVEIVRRYGDPLVKLIEMPFNLGQVAAMNAGLEAARGRYILFHGDDDWLEVDGLAPLVAAMDAAGNDVGFAYGHLQYHGRRNDLMRAVKYNRDDYKRHFPAGTGLIWRRCLHTEKGIRYRKLHEGKTAHAEDFDLVLQIIKAGYVGQAVDAMVIHYTLADGRATSWLHAHQDEGPLQTFKKRHPEFLGRL